MSMTSVQRFRRAVQSLFSHLGMEAEYWPADGTPPYDIAVIAKQPDRLYEAGEALLHGEDIQFEFMVADVLVPQRGDDIHFNDEIYRIDAEPLLEQHQLVWRAAMIKL